MLVELRDCHLDDKARALGWHLAQRFDAFAAAVTPLSREDHHGELTREIVTLVHGSDAE
jgi:hypothetical protein